jgi:acetyl esterase/lipase
MRRAIGLAARGVLVAVAILLSGCFGTLNALTPKSTSVRTTDIAYGPQPRQKLDVYRPVSPPPPGGWPVAVYFYGGSWTFGDRAEYEFLGESLASRGVLAVVADYRRFPDVRYPDFLVDSASATDWALANAERFGGNPRRLFLFGHSAGAYNAAMVAIDPRWLAVHGRQRSELAGWIGLAGPYDFYPLHMKSVQPIFHHPDYPPASQPALFPLAGTPPAFLAAGAEDRMVEPRHNTLGMARRLREAGVPVTAKLYPNVDHVMVVATFAYPLRWLGWTLPDIADFIHETPPTRPH